jgi:prolyl-tRNA synthetase
MRLSRLLAPTLKEAPREAEIPSHALLVRAGFIRKVAAGIYDFLPLALRSVRKIENIVREELDAAGAQEILMPIVQPKEFWEDSGRWGKYGPELLRFKDRKGSEFCLGPTHEEMVTDIVRRDVRSYRDLPLNLYQIQVKFRDEIRPRAGLMRGREFIMKDAYSFDVDADAARTSYQAMYDAYVRIFTRCGLDFRPVEADTGAIGGSLSHEFQVLAETGEDSIVACDTCDYAANVEQAEVRPADAANPGPAVGELVEVSTPDQRTIAEVSAFLEMPPSRFIKSLVYVTDAGDAALVLVRGDREVNEVKLRKALGTPDVYLATDDEVGKLAKAPLGFVGPVGFRGDMPILADPEVMALRDAATGANKKHLHLRGVNPERDFKATQVVDLRAAGGGDPCARCEGVFRNFRGIEVGHVFFLGSIYSEAMGATYLGEDGKQHPSVMGCYGIGITRILAAAIEQRHDDAGICWPTSIAPYEVVVLGLGKKGGGDEGVEAERIYEALRKRGVDALLDDRPARPGFKFKDADLMGFPLRVAIGGRGLTEGVAEVKLRTSGGEPDKVPLDQVVDHVVSTVEALRQELRP